MEDASVYKSLKLAPYCVLVIVVSRNYEIGLRTAVREAPMLQSEFNFCRNQISLVNGEHIH
jgi:hypothetical protein